MSSSTPSNSPFWARWWSQVFGSSEGSVRESIEDVLGDSAADDEDGFSREELHMLRNLLGFRDVRIEAHDCQSFGPAQQRRLDR